MQSENNWKLAVAGLAVVAGAYVVYRTIKSYKEEPKKKSPTFVYIGTYTEKQFHILGDKLGKGIYTLQLEEDGTLTQTCEPAPSRSPAFVRTTPDKRFLYTINEIMDYGGSTNDASVTAFSIDQSTGTLTQI